MFTKAKFFNLALGDLLLSRQITQPDTDKSNEAAVLRTFYDVAWMAALADMDLDATSSQARLELTETFDPNVIVPLSQWHYAYKYPSNCAFFRRIQSCQIMDNKTSHIPKRVGIYAGKKVIFTNQQDAIAEFIPLDIPLTLLSASAGLAVSHRLAIMGAPLITGKGAKRLMDDIGKKYVLAKMEAQQQDARENFNFEDDALISEFVETRMS